MQISELNTARAVQCPGRRTNWKRLSFPNIIFFLIVWKLCTMNPNNTSHFSQAHPPILAPPQNTHQVQFVLPIYSLQRGQTTSKAVCFLPCFVAWEETKPSGVDHLLRSPHTYSPEDLSNHSCVSHDTETGRGKAV